MVWLIHAISKRNSRRKPKIKKLDTRKTRLTIRRSSRSMIKR